MSYPSADVKRLRTALDAIGSVVAMVAYDDAAMVREARSLILEAVRDQLAEAVEAAGDGIRDKYLEAGVMTLGALAETLAGLDPDLAVSLDGQHVPGSVYSYRGYYDHAAIEPVRGPAGTVGRLARDLTMAIGSVVNGWKGGTYVLTRSAPVWVADGGPS